MKSYGYNIIATLCLCVIFSTTSNAQKIVTTISDPDAQITITKSTSGCDLRMGIYGDVENESNIKIERGSSICFIGCKWKNAPTATIAGEGWVEFVTPFDSSKQYLEGGGVAFPSLRVMSKSGIQLCNTPTIVTDTIEFVEGHIILDTIDICLGDSTNAGHLKGYCKDSYFVTDANPFSGKGNLIRNKVGTQELVYPIGSAKGDYTPVAVKNTGTETKIKIRVFPNVYANGTNGTTYGEKTVGKTWCIDDGSTGNSNLELRLQHNESTEGSGFNKSSQYIAKYTGSSPNSSGGETSYTKWDYTGDSNCGDATTNHGDIGSCGIDSTAKYASRSGLTSGGLFTTAGCYRNMGTPLPVDFIGVGVAWAEHDAEIVWQTATEVNNDYFSIERSLNGNDYESIGTVKGAGHSTNLLDYTFVDKKAAGLDSDNISYRIKQIDFDGAFDYSNIVELSMSDSKAAQSFSLVGVAPNPFKDNLMVSMTTAKVEKIVITLKDLSGRTIHSQVYESHIGLNTLHYNVYQSIASGMYILNVESRTQSEAIRVIKN